MDRYRYAFGILSFIGRGWNVDLEEDETRQEDIAGFMVFDMQRGHGRENGEENWLAFSRDRDDAERIVRLLNDDERLKAQAAMRGGKEPS